MRDFNDRFFFIIVVVVVIAAVAISIFSFFLFQSVRQTLLSNIIKTKMKKIKARLTWYIIIIDLLHVWCYQCVQHLKNNWSIMYMFSSSSRRQKCDRYLMNKHACAFDSIFLKLQMQLRHYVVISITMSLFFYKEIFQRALREWCNK